MSGGNHIFKAGDQAFFALYGATPYTCQPGQQPSYVYRGNYNDSDAGQCSIDLCVPNDAKMIGLRHGNNKKPMANDPCSAMYPGTTLNPGMWAEDFVPNCTNPLQPGPSLCPNASKYPKY